MARRSRGTAVADPAYYSLKNCQLNVNSLEKGITMTDEAGGWAVPGQREDYLRELENWREHLARAEQAPPAEA